MKSYTDIEQSKKLAEILPLESADIYYFTIIHDYPYSQGKIKIIAKIMDGSFSSDYDTPCWSLAALLEQLNDTITCDDGREYFLNIYKEDSRYYLSYHNRWGSRYEQDIETDYYDNFVDACVEMIIKLNEHGLVRY